MLYKVKITNNDYIKFKKYFDTKGIIQETDKAMHKRFDGKWNIKEISLLHDVFKNMFNLFSMGWTENNYTFDNMNGKIDTMIDYVANNDTAWTVDFISGEYLLISFSGFKLFWMTQFCELIELPDYDGVTMNELTGKISSDQDFDNLLPATMNGLSVNLVKTKKDEINKLLSDLEKQKSDISYLRQKELAEMEKKIRELRDILNARKAAMMQDLNEKMKAMQEEVDKLNLQIYMMESKIYMIRSYTGETIEFKQVRSGIKMPDDVPLVINQRLIYLDEDLARIVSVYKEELASRYGLFEDALKYCDEVFDSFCPQDKCITCFRLSKSAETRYYDSNCKMYMTEALIHGKKIGFILRDGENAYLGWADEVWGKDSEGDPRYVAFTENLMHKPEKEVRITNLDDYWEISDDSQETMLSRLFIMSMIQGILDEGSILTFPEKVNVLKPGKYIIYNYAYGWISDNRFGDFATLVDNLNKRTKVKDQILITYNKNYCSGRGSADRTYDCNVPEGINRINFLEPTDEYGHCNIYVSAKKKFSRCGSTANVLVNKNEYINLTYMNSIWFKYYVQTKKMGRYAEDYAKMIKHFRRSIEVLEEREEIEINAIKKYYPDADKIPEWQIKLSHWKLHNNIRFITDFQAKRIAKYFVEGNFIEMSNLFEQETFYKDNLDEYCTTGFEERYKGPVNDQSNAENEFSRNNDYYYQTFYINLKNRKWNKDSVEEDRLTVLKELPKLEAMVPGRIVKDEKKLCLIDKVVMDFLDMHNITAEEIKNSGNLPDFLSVADLKIGFIQLSELSAEGRKKFFDNVSRYEPYIIQSECWKIAYYDMIQRQFDKVLHNAKLLLHERFMAETRSV